MNQPRPPYVVAPGASQQRIRPVERPVEGGQGLDLGGDACDRGERRWLVLRMRTSYSFIGEFTR